jgi:hypothetical protein
MEEIRFQEVFVEQSGNPFFNGGPDQTVPIQVPGHKPVHLPPMIITWIQITYADQYFTFNGIHPKSLSTVFYKRVKEAAAILPTSNLL